MKRDYNTGTTEGITFFVGTEIEKTPAYGMDTLFVVGVHDPEVIIDIIKDPNKVKVNVKHIYLGANQSFNPTIDNAGAYYDIRMWEDMIYVLLEAGYWCTLDFDVRFVNEIHESCLCEKRRFIPQISVKIPGLQLLNYNATIKIDDTDFNASNPGVWCHRLRDLTTTESFTDWDQYRKDEIIK